MLIYILIFLFLFVLSTLEVFSIQIKPKLGVAVFVFMLFVFLDGFRWETGTDWKPYLEFFSLDDFKEKWNTFEPGFIILNIACKQIFNSYTVYLIFIAGLTYLLYFKSIMQYTSMPWLTILAFYCIFIGYMGMQRQHIALSICLFSIRYIVRSNFYKFVIIIIIASLFHVSALMFIIAYFLNKHFSYKFYIVLFSSSILLHFIMQYAVVSLIPILPDTIALKVHVYTSNGTSEFSFNGFIFGLIKRVLIFMVLHVLIQNTNLRKNIPNIELMLNIYFISIIIYLIFSNSIQVMVGRGALYFGSLFEIFLIPAFVLVTKKRSKWLTYFLVIVFLILTFLKSISVFYNEFVPYKGIFINSNFTRVD